jgi:hypothetical protein
MLQVEHLMVNDVVDGVLRDSRMIEDPTHYDGIVSGIVMTQAVAGTVAAPGELWPGQKPVEKSGVQIFKHRLQIIDPTLCRVQAFTPAYLPHQVCLSCDVVAGDVTAIPGRRLALHGFAVHFR